MTGEKFAKMAYMSLPLSLPLSLSLQAWSNTEANFGQQWPAQKLILKEANKIFRFHLAKH